MVEFEEWIIKMNKNKIYICVIWVRWPFLSLKPWSCVSIVHWWCWAVGSFKTAVGFGSDPKCSVWCLQVVWAVPGTLASSHKPHSLQVDRQLSTVGQCEGVSGCFSLHNGPTINWHCPRHRRYLSSCSLLLHLFSLLHFDRINNNWHQWRPHSAQWLARKKEPYMNSSIRCWYFNPSKSCVTIHCSEIFSFY